MLRMLRDFWTNRKLIWKLAKNDFKTRYAGSYFGVVWAMVQPVVIVLVYWFVFQIGLNNATAELKQGITVPFEVPDSPCRSGGLQDTDFIPIIRDSHADMAAFL